MSSHSVVLISNRTSRTTITTTPILRDVRSRHPTTFTFHSPAFAPGSIGPESGASAKCEPQENATPAANSSAQPEHKSSETKKTFWEKTEDDPTAYFTMWLVIFTGVLSTVSIVQIAFLIRTDRTARIASEAATESNRLNREMFVAENRPWLQMNVTPVGPASYGADGTLTVTMRVSVKNIGKTPAFNVGSGGAGTHVGYEGFREYFEGIREFTERVSESKGKTIFPQEEESWDDPVVVTAEQFKKVDPNVGGTGNIYVGFSYKYRSSLAEEYLETSRLYWFWIDKKDNTVVSRIFLEYVT